MKQITVLGSTGSIGVNTLDVIARHPDRYRVFALSAATRIDVLAKQCQVFSPRYAVIPDADGAERLRAQLRACGADTLVLAGPESLDTIASHADVDAVMAAIVGAAGLPATLAAARAGKRVLLANKEALVMAGALFMDAIRTGGASLLPIDSEHNAVFQCLPRQVGALAELGVRRVILTASGGPFRTQPRETLAQVTPEQACAHPNWVMGRKISVDSATMMNKGLEVIEARWLFDAQPEQIDVLIHPQSIIHSMVEYLDGSVIAQLGNPDMRTPIAYGLAWPERIDAGVATLDLAKIANLEFAALDPAQFPCVGLAYAALRQAGTAAAILNAANELAVEAFLDRRLAFLDIPRVIERVLELVPAKEADSLSTVFLADAEARRVAIQLLREPNRRATFQSA